MKKVWKLIECSLYFNFRLTLAPYFQAKMTLKNNFQFSYSPYNHVQIVFIWYSLIIQLLWIVGGKIRKNMFFMYNSMRIICIWVIVIKIDFVVTNSAQFWVLVSRNFFLDLLSTNNRSTQWMQNTHQKTECSMKYDYSRSRHDTKNSTKVPHKKVKLATLVEGNPKVPFSITTTPMSREGHYSFPWIASLYPWSLLYNAEC